MNRSLVLVSGQMCLGPESLLFTERQEPSSETMQPGRPRQRLFPNHCLPTAQLAEEPPLRSPAQLPAGCRERTHGWQTMYGGSHLPGGRDLSIQVTTCRQVAHPKPSDHLNSQRQARWQVGRRKPGFVLKSWCSAPLRNLQPFQLFFYYLCT